MLSKEEAKEYLKAGIWLGFMCTTNQFNFEATQSIPENEVMQAVDDAVEEIIASLPEGKLTFTFDNAKKADSLSPLTTGRRPL